MKKGKLTLALVTSFSAIMALTACNETSYKDGVVLTYTDNSGKRTEYKASDLLDNYEQGSSAASTNFNKVKEVLIRKYYESSSKSATLASLKTNAQNSVDSIKKQAQSNADSNGTTYATELETLLSSNNVDNVSELFEAKLYEEEQKDFERQFKDATAVEAMKTGKDKDGNAYFPNSDTYGRGSNGWLIEQTPYHVSHFLVKFSSSSHGEACQFTITKDESKKISQAVKAFAGVVTTSEDGKKQSVSRESFGDICNKTVRSDDSAENYGNLGLMESGYVPEFRLGVYAYDALYNKKHTADNSYARDKDNHNIAGNDDEGEIRDHVLPSANDTYGPQGNNTRDYFSALKIGTIPYGAAVALGYDGVASNPNLGYTVNDDDATYYARNIIFNKYFNNRSVAVIVPESIDFNSYYENGSWNNGVNMSEADAEAYVAKEKNSYENGRYAGTYSSDYANLPGFTRSTSDVLDLQSKDADGNVHDVNALTNESGQIILAVKASNSSGNAYEGIHFIVVNRSSLDAYVNYDAETATYTAYNSAEEAKAAGKDVETTDTTSLSEYFTVESPEFDVNNIPANKDFPHYGSDGKAKSTFVNRLKTTETNYQDNADKISSAIKSYNSSEDTYEFQKLIEDEKLVFSDNDLGKKIKNLVQDYISATREKNHEDEVKTLDDAWDSYAETLERQNEDRDIKDGRQRLISECVAITYRGTDAQKGEGMYASDTGTDSEGKKTGGIGYDGKK